MGRNHQQQKRNNTRGPCRFHTKWLWLVLAAAVMGAFGTLEAVTLAQDSVYREAMRPFPELVIASVLRVAHTHAVRLCSRCGLDRCAACNFVGVVGCVVLIARAALCKAADPSAELRGLRSTGFCSYVYTLSSVSLHSIVATYFLTLTSVLLVSFCTHTHTHALFTCACTQQTQDREGEGAVATAVEVSCHRERRVCGGDCVSGGLHCCGVHHGMPAAAQRQVQRRRGGGASLTSHRVLLSTLSLKRCHNDTTLS